MEIRDRELYKIRNGGEYQTFEAYCKGAWDFTKSYANYLISSNEVMENLTTTVVKPSAERQTRPPGLDFRDREGYDSWAKCVVAEFGQSRQQLYRLLEAAEIENLAIRGGKSQ
jgi:hypothetical protein